jgi:hypothetical protein
MLWSGWRARLEPSIYAHLAGDPLGTHEYYKDTRDKHIAHPVNAFEEVRVGVAMGNQANLLESGIWPHSVSVMHPRVWRNWARLPRWQCSMW